jgi:hypothetical protein
MGAHDKLDAVAATCAFELMRTCDCVWVRFEGSKTWNPEVNMLSCLPLEVHILDGNDSGGLSNNAGNDSMPKVLHTLTLSSLWSKTDILP